MNGRELHSAVIIKTDTCLREVKEKKTMMQERSFKFNALVLQSHLQPFSKRSQKLVGLDLNVAKWFRQKTASGNEKFQQNATLKHLEFPTGRSDEELNEDMKRCMHGIMCERLRAEWETKSWNVIYCQDKRTGEHFIKEAAERPEMAVIAQSAGFWAVRTIAEQRQKSTKRAAEQRKARNKKRFCEYGMTARHRKGVPLQLRNEKEQTLSVQNHVMESEENHMKGSDEANEILIMREKNVSMTEPAVEMVPDIECYDDDSCSEESPDNEEEMQKLELSSKETKNQIFAKKSQDDEDKVKLMLEGISPEKLQLLLAELMKSALEKEHHERNGEAGQEMDSLQNEAVRPIQKKRRGKHEKEPKGTNNKRMALGAGSSSSKVKRTQKRKRKVAGLD